MRFLSKGNQDDGGGAKGYIDFLDKKEPTLVTQNLLEMA